MHKTLTLTTAEVLALHHDTPNRDGPAWGTKTPHALPVDLPPAWGTYALWHGRLVERKGGCFIHSSTRLPFRVGQALGIVEPVLNRIGAPAALLLEQVWGNGIPTFIPRTRPSRGPARLTVYVREVALIRLPDLTDEQLCQLGGRAVPGGFTLDEHAAPRASAQEAFFEHWRCLHGEEEHPQVWLLTLDPPLVRLDAAGAARVLNDLTTRLETEERTLAALVRAEEQANRRRWQQRGVVAELKLRLERQQALEPAVQDQAS